MDFSPQDLTIRFTDDPKLSTAVADALRAAELIDAGYAFLADLRSMRRAAHRASEAIYPASVIKVAIMAEAFRRFARGDLRPDDRVTITPNNLTATDEPTPLVSGYAATLQELVELMIERSDNIATNQLIDVLRRERITASMHRLGLATFFLGRKLSGAEPLVEDPEMTGRNRLPPDEIGRLLTLIATDRVPGAAAQRAILGTCRDRGKLSAGLLAGDRFMHKTGQTSDTSHDAGILETSAGARYVVVLYTVLPPAAGDDASRVDSLMARWMRRLRQAL